ncbi:MAG: hypothetical protein LBU90_02795 [Bacteroidales bacterium]|jgi:hypothetical protein|nr:hypothetical protein [Bacteroidales bacterium]
MIAFFSFLVWKVPFFRNSALRTWHILSAFYLKLCLAVAFFLIYTHYAAYRQQSDSQAFYHSAAQFAGIAYADFGDFVRASVGISPKNAEIAEQIQHIPLWNRPYDMAVPNDTRFTLILYSWLYLISFGFLPLMLIFSNIIAFLGLFALFRAFLLAGSKKLPAAIACFAIPSTLFWSSGLLKEVWLLLFLGFILYSALQFFATRNIRFALFALLWAIALIHIKIYIAAIALPLIGIFALRRTFPRTKAMVFYLCAFGGFAFAAILLCLIFNYNSVEIIVNQRNTFVRMLEFQNHSTILLTTFSGSYFMAALHMLAGFFQSLLRPSLFDVHNIWLFFAGIENTLIVVLILCALFYCVKNNCKPSDYAILAIVFVIAVFVLIGFTTPNLGALQRYKSPLLPFVVVLCGNAVCTYRNFPFKNCAV